jgi:hypothetical protein
MASQTHLRILKQGVHVWNSWRHNRASISPDLSEADLTNRNLAGVNFSNTNLDGADFTRTGIFLPYVGDELTQQAVFVLLPLDILLDWCKLCFRHP